MINNRVIIIVVDNKRIECKVCNKWMAKTSYTKHTNTIKHKANEN